MKSFSIALVVVVALVISASPASAQRRTVAARRAPAPGMIGVGASIGADIPQDDNLDKGLDIAGTVEGYVTSRVSVRGQVGTAWWDIVGRGFTGTVKPVYFDANLVYNWEGGAVHPYVTAGIGAYKFRSTENGAPDGSDTKAGFNVGGGAEFFFTPRATFTAEALFHKVDGFATPRGTFSDGSFWRIALGMKAYF
jgi:opacity protein-like surface antigen